MYVIKKLEYITSQKTVLAATSFLKKAINELFDFLKYICVGHLSRKIPTLK